MQSNTVASSSSHPPNTEPHRRVIPLRTIISLALLTVLTSACAQGHEPLAQRSADTVSSPTSSKDKKPMETSQQIPAIPVMTAEEASHRMLDLIAKIKTAEDVSFKNLEIATGLKVYPHPTKPNEYGTGAKITDTWFVNFGVTLGVKEGERSNLTFSFDDQTHSSASMTDICQVDFDAYKKRLTELGFQSKPYYGEHGRLISWDFTRGNLDIGIYIRGESNEKVTHDCVSMIDIYI